jgi:hypothetical protein
MTEDLQQLLDRAERELEAALRGASLCAVSRDPRQGGANVKFLEGRWYTLRDVQRRLEQGAPDALADVAAELERRTPQGPAWADYAAGAASALEDARAVLDRRSADAAPGS